MPPLPIDTASALREREDALKEEHRAYLERHPEIQNVLSDFISSALAEQPVDVFDYARTHFTKAAPGGAAEPKSSWPELVGTEGAAAVEKIMAERPGLKVQTLPQGSMVTADFREDRVRVFVSEAGVVTTPVPRVG